MKIDAWIREGLNSAAQDARSSEELGFDGAWNSEAKSDAFLGSSSPLNTNRPCE